MRLILTREENQAAPFLKLLIGDLVNFVETESCRSQEKLRRGLEVKEFPTAFTRETDDEGRFCNLVLETRIGSMERNLRVR